MATLLDGLDVGKAAARAKVPVRAGPRRLGFGRFFAPVHQTLSISFENYSRRLSSRRAAMSDRESVICLRV